MLVSMASANAIWFPSGSVIMRTMLQPGIIDERNC
jgi:hypothetical protein